MKISWFKFDADFFSDEKIKIIEGKPQGDTFLKIWVRFLCMAIKAQRPGFIEIMDGVPYDLAELAAVCGVAVETMTEALKLFYRYGMVTVTEGSPIEIVHFCHWQNVEAIDRMREQGRERVAKYRAKQRKIDKKAGNDVTHDVTHRLDQRRTDKIRDINTTPAVADVATNPEADMVWKVVYKHRKDTGTLPVAKGPQVQFYTRERKICDELVKTHGMETVARVFDFATRDAFWKKQTLTPSRFPQYKAAMDATNIKITNNPEAPFA